MHLDAAAEQFRRNFAEHDELGASVSVWQGGREILSLHEGWADRERTRPWTSETLVPVWSATKGPAALTVLLALHEAGLSVHDPVSTLWPELGAARGGTTFAQVLSHQAGLPALSPERRPSLLAYSEVVAALEAQQPWWEPGRAHGYHPRTYGYLLDEIVRRATSKVSLARYWNEKVSAPLGIDFKIGGLGVPELERLAEVLPPTRLQPPESERDFYQALGKADSLPSMAFASPAGMRALSHINQLDHLQAGLPALGGVGSARGLAKFYQILACGGIWEGRHAFPERVVAAARRIETSGRDLTFLIPTAFTCGFMAEPGRSPQGTSAATEAAAAEATRLYPGFGEAFGHPGAGGSHAFADPGSGLSFAYVMNRMGSGILPGRRSLDIISALKA